MKDPALLWYFNDWTGGTTTLSRHLKGCYMDILAAQFNSGPLTLDEIKTVLGSDFGSWPAIQKKFKFENGLYFNDRLAIEKLRRSTYSESRRKNVSNRYVGDMKPYMEDINENRIINETSISYYGEFKKVKLTPEQMQKLVDRFGHKNTELLIAELDTYMASKGKKYADHYATILNWARRKVTEHVEKLPAKKIGTV